MLCVTSLVLTGCGDPEVPPRAPTEVPARPSTSASDEAEVPQEEGPSAWPHEVEPLARTLEHFTTVEACVATLRTSTPGAVAEVLSDLRYHAFFEDTCHSLAAARAAEPQRCEQVSVAPLQRACRARAAALGGLPDECPPDGVAAGRDPTCLAWATRSPLLCHGASSVDRATCEAVLSRDPARCRRPDVTERAQCEAWVARWGSSLGESQPAVQIDAQFTARAWRVEDRAPDVEVASSDLDFQGLVARGIALLAGDARCSYQIVIGDGYSGAGILSRPTLTMDVQVSAGATLPLTVLFEPLRRSLSISAPGVGSSRGLDGQLVIDSLEPERGGAFAGHFEGHGDLPLSQLRMTGEFRTFIRDIENLPAECRSVDEGAEMPSEK